MNQIRIISDVHGKINKYLDVVNKCEYSVQLGDLAFDYRFLGNIDDTRHVFIPGNHDNYDKCFAYPHCLGNFGEFELNGIVFFFIRGAFSIDWQYRQKHQELTGQKSWWSNEELSFAEMKLCFDLYREVKPDFVISHDCPRIISNKIGNPQILNNFGYNADIFTTSTSELLEECYNFHAPKIWIFGHYHIDIQVNLKTKFICLPELGYCDVNSNLEVSD